MGSQDTPYFNFVGPHTIGFWVCLDGYVPKENCAPDSILTLVCWLRDMVGEGLGCVSVD